MLEARPVAEALVVFAPRDVVTNPLENPLLVARSSTKPVSLFELSVQLRSICVVEPAVALSPLGAVGAEGSDVGTTEAREPPYRISSKLQLPLLEALRTAK